jgi:hypothetical protein
MVMFANYWRTADIRAVHQIEELSVGKNAWPKGRARRRRRSQIRPLTTAMKKTTTTMKKSKNGSKEGKGGGVGDKLLADEFPTLWKRPRE